MPAFENGESGLSVRNKINTAIEQIEAFENSNLTYTTAALFEAAVAAGLTADNGTTAFAAAVKYVAESGNTSIAALPGWRYADAEVKTQYERNSNTNAFTDAEQTKLSGIETGATADQTDAEIAAAYGAEVPQVTPTERTAGTETAVRRWSPLDVATTAGIHGGGGGGTDDFATRAAFIAWVATEAVGDGTVVYADGTGYRKETGATDISDAADWRPLNQTATPKQFGAAADAQSSATGVMTSGSATLTAGSVFVAGDVGKAIKVEGAGAAAADLVTTIATYVSATEVTLGGAAGTTVSAANFTWGTDDTNAIEAAFAWIDNGDPLRQETSSARDIFQIGVDRNVYFDPGFYIYNGAGVRMQNGAGRNITFFGDDPSNAMVAIFSDAFFLDLQVADPAPNSIYCFGMTFFGGKGLYLNRQTTSVPQGYQTFDRVRCIGFSVVAIASMWGDSPRWTVTNCHIETTKPNTKGILCPPGFAHSKMYNTTIVGCTAKVVLSNKQQSLQLITGMTFFSLDEDDHQCDVWIQPVDTGVEGFTNIGSGVTFTGNRFSSENRGGTPVFLIADADGVGDYWEQMPSLATTSNSFRDMQIVDNVMGGEGTADTTAGPVVYSYTPDLGAIKIADNLMNVGFSHLLYIDGAVGNAGRLPDANLGPNNFSPTGSDEPLHCNLDVGLWRNSDGLEVFSSGTNLPSDGGWDHNYALISKDGSGNAASMADMVLGGSASSAATAGPFDESSKALNVTFTASGGGADYVQSPVTGVGLIEAGQNCYVEFDVKQAPANSITELDVKILMTYSAGSSTISRSVPVPSNWKRVRVPFRGNLAMNGLQVRLFPSADGFTASTADSVLIDNVSVKAANRTVNSGHIITTNAAWDAAHEVMHESDGQGELHIYPDWTDELLRAEFAAPTSETSGSILPMMVNSGAGRFFTPTLYGNSTAGTATYAGGGRSGYFIEIGNFVVGFGYINWSGHTGTGAAKIDLDYVPAARDSNAANRGLFFCQNFSGFTIPASSPSIVGFVERGASNIGIRYRASTGDTEFPMASLSSGSMNFMFAYEKA